MSGFSPPVRARIKRRSGKLCERCGIVPGVEAHHRRTRAMGGTKRGSTNTASNAGWLCGWCHRWVTEHPNDGRREGWVVRQSQDPAGIPVLYQKRWAYLADDGSLHFIDTTVRQQT